MSIQTTELSNGLTVISDSLPGFETVAVGLWVDVGARDETFAQNGLSHMLEHMAFKGTTSRSALDIALAVERVGGHLNAYTAREQTCFFARVLKDDAPLAVDILADILLNPSFESGEIAREQQVIVQEIGQAEDTPDDILFDHLQEAAYPDQAFGRPILGSVKHVTGFGAEDLRQYLGEHYRGGRMVLAAAGGIEHDVLVALGEEYCGGFASGKAPQDDSPAFKANIYLEPRALEQAHVALAFDGVEYGHQDYYAAQVLATALGGGMSSRLFQEIREKRGLAYSVSAWASPASDCGSYGFYAGTSQQDLPELLSVLQGEIGRAAAGFSE
ncbi:MAG: M16 family metallopeptidase, partial [Alphaproteobacteria bacterium]